MTQLALRLEIVAELFCMRKLGRIQLLVNVPCTRMAFGEDVEAAVTI